MELVLEEDRADYTSELETIRRQSGEMAKVITDVRVLLESIQDTYSLEERNLSETLADELANVQAKTEGEIRIEATIPDDVVSWRTTSSPGSSGTCSRTRSSTTTARTPGSR